MEKSEADGQLVNIPARRHVSDGGTEDISRSALMVWHRWLKDRCTGKSVQLALMRNSEQALGQVFTWPSSVKRLPRKTSMSRLIGKNMLAPYRKPTLVDRASSPRGTSDFSLRNSAKKRP